MRGQRAFDVYRGDTVGLPPLTLRRADPGKPWLRIEGLVTLQSLLRNHRALLAAR